MLDMRIIVWSLPLLFVFHDFEEIICMNHWVRKNEARLTAILPERMLFLVRHMKQTSTAAFSAGVAEEYGIIMLVSMIAYRTDWYYLWLGLFIAFMAHLVVHILQAIAVRGYVPALFTSVLCIPVSLCILMRIGSHFIISKAIMYSFLGLAIMIINLIAVHALMEKLDRYFSRAIAPNS